jgi:membrane protease YdiL (CAAX protease family)
MIGTVAVMPYVLELMADQFEKAVEESGLSRFALVAVSIVQSGVLIAIAVLAGLWASRKLNLRAPISEALVNRQPVGSIAKEFLLLSLTLGAAAGALLVLLDRLVFEPLIPEFNPAQLPQPAVWKGALASLYGGIAEELLCRLFLLSVIALALRWISRTPVGLPRWIFWTANLLVALLFGLGHLPAAAAILPLTPMWVTRVLVLNGVFAVVMGYLFWKRGLESAMLAHWTGDIVLHVIAPLLFGTSQSP